MSTKKIFIILFFVAFFGTCFGQTSDLKNEVATNQYSVRHSKLKELYIKQLTSTSYVQLHTLLNNFLKKAPADIQKIKTFEEYLPWIKANLDKTTFKTFAEAEEEWAAIEIAKENEAVENKEYHDFVFDCLIATKSSEILINAREDVEAEHPELFPKPVCPAIKS